MFIRIFPSFIIYLQNSSVLEDIYAGLLRSSKIQNMQASLLQIARSATIKGSESSDSDPCLSKINGEGTAERQQAVRSYGLDQILNSV